ncbi:MAG: prolipoprotein diacylglyceryl transferase, partial [Myxococcales bacterium]|nr:prolipoprotein diacylglyceryl transferase [Myxococcales bacterium]
VISHWVSVLFYFPEKVTENPWILLMLWNGLSSVGGFFGAFVGMNWFLRRENQPILVYADGNMFGLLLGMCFGRLSCAWVHDHPGKIVTADTFAAVGPWPCRCPEGRALPECCSAAQEVFRYDLGLYEFAVILGLTLFAYFVWDWRKAAPGKLTGLVAMVYGPTRFGLDFLRAGEADRVSAPDLRYLGLTPAQYFALAFFAAGVWLFFLRKPTDADLDYARDSERLRRAQERAKQREAEAAEAEAEAEPDEPEAKPPGPRLEGVAQALEQRGHRRPALGGVDREPADDRLVQRPRDPSVRRRALGSGEDAPLQRLDALAGERRDPVEGGVERDAEAELIAARAAAAPGELLGGHERRGAAGAGRLDRAHRA